MAKKIGVVIKKIKVVEKIGVVKQLVITKVGERLWN